MTAAGWAEVNCPNPHACCRGASHRVPIMLIRELRLSELPTLLDFIKAKATFDGCPESLKPTVGSLRDALFSSKPLAYALVAEVDARIVGVATCYATFSSFISKPRLWLDYLFVVEASRNLGVGAALMKRLCSIAVAGGCCRIDWHVASRNERGQKFYRRLGATISENERRVRMTEETIHSLAQADANDSPTPAIPRSSD